MGDVEQEPMRRSSDVEPGLSSEERYRLLAENASDIVYQTNGLVIQWISPSVTHWLGWDPDELVGAPALSLLAPDQDLSWVESNRDELLAGHSVIQEMELRHRDGTKRWFEGRARPMMREGDAVGGFMVGLHDIHEQRLARRALLLSEKRYRSAMEHAGVGMALMNSKFEIVNVNEALCEFVGRAEHELIGRSWSLVTNSDDLAMEAELFDRISRGELDSFRRVERFTDSRGQLLYGDVTVAAARDDDGSVVLLTKQVVDITEQTTSRRRLADLAARDPLTSLSNRSTVMQAIERALTTAGEDAERVGVLFADLDNFKLINETLGHIAGDELLKAVAERFTTYLGREAVVGRFGGDEFVIVAPQPADESLLTYYAHLMTQSLLDDFYIAGRRVVMTTSVGAALSRPGSTATGLLQDADVALSEAKRDGKARWRIFDLRMADAAMARLETEAALRVALEQDEFIVHYQPIHQLSDNRRTGFEALVRWNHPEHGLLTPDSFLPVAEDSSLITVIGAQVLARVCQDMQGRPDSGDHVAVNVSAIEIAQPQWFDATLATIEDSGIDPTRLTIELTETAVMSTRRDLSLDLRRLRDLGVGIHVDDFGTGYSSIALLRDLPVTGIKLDRSFVTSLSEPDSASYALAEGLASLAFSIGLIGVAEGIETPVQSAFLRGMGWTHGQGYLFGKPAVLDEWVHASG
jgi:diguanylate cyclase (GGDEF)-like protein/PAS domain S-box-containing protein